MNCNSKWCSTQICNITVHTKILHNHRIEECPFLVRQLICNLCFLSFRSYLINHHFILVLTTFQCANKNMFPLFWLPINKDIVWIIDNIDLLNLPCFNSTSTARSLQDCVHENYGITRKDLRTSQQFIYMWNECYSCVFVSCKKITTIIINKTPNKWLHLNKCKNKITMSQRFHLAFM